MGGLFKISTALTATGRSGATHFYRTGEKVNGTLHKSKNGKIKYLLADNDFVIPEQNIVVPADASFTEETEKTVTPNTTDSTLQTPASFPVEVNSDQAQKTVKENQALKKPWQKGAALGSIVGLTAGVVFGQNKLLFAAIGLVLGSYISMELAKFQMTNHKIPKMIN